MDFFQALASNRILVCAALSWAVAQILKVLLSLLIHRRLDWRRAFGMGGMPSSHTALVVSLMAMTGVVEGVGSTAFALSFALTGVVIYDALGVRAETGKQGAALNRILREVLIEGQPITEERFKELVGHTPLEVLGGVIVAVVVVLCMA